MHCSPDLELQCIFILCQGLSVFVIVYFKNRKIENCLDSNECQYIHNK